MYWGGLGISTVLYGKKYRIFDQIFGIRDLLGRNFGDFCGDLGGDLWGFGEAF